jgi:hypothetical protein
MPGRVQLVLTSPNFSIDTKTSSQIHLLKRALTSDLMAAQNSTFFQRNKLFSGGIFMGLLTSLILIIVMVISLRCLLSVQSPLRFEKPVKVKQ